MAWKCWEYVWFFSTNMCGRDASVPQSSGVPPYSRESLFFPKFSTQIIKKSCQFPQISWISWISHRIYWKSCALKIRCPWLFLEKNCFYQFLPKFKLNLDANFILVGCVMWELILIHPKHVWTNWSCLTCLG